MNPNEPKFHVFLSCKKARKKPYFRVHHGSWFIFFEGKRNSSTLMYCDLTESV